MWKLHYVRIYWLKIHNVNIILSNGITTSVTWHVIGITAGEKAYNLRRDETNKRNMLNASREYKAVIKEC